LSRYDVIQVEGGRGSASNDPTLKCGKRSEEQREEGVEKTRFLYDAISGQAPSKKEAALKV
jgi:hypothetical protein